jgi:hypothetical protein
MIRRAATGGALARFADPIAKLRAARALAHARAAETAQALERGRRIEAAAAEHASALERQLAQTE